MSVDARRETYTHGYSEEMSHLHGARIAAVDAAFFVPHLKAGMRVLDCGCGPGSITVGFAELVAPGEVVGVDLAEEQLVRARGLADRRRLGNVHFERGDIYALPFPDSSFDAAFAHNVLEHLRDPLQALKEMRRVLRPGGIVGVLDDDWGAYLLEPSTPLRRYAVDLALRVVELNGGNFLYARHQRRLLREAGFTRTEGHTGPALTPEHLHRFARAAAEQFRDPGFAATVLAQKWGDQATLEAIALDFLAWDDDPDAYIALVSPAALGWVGQD
jgi:ubiquinone/menaquinone biosynthesis C-methylase UbiE